jgi:hypothetical protein
MKIVIFFFECFQKQNRFFLIRFDNVPAEHLGYSGFLLTRVMVIIHIPSAHSHSYLHAHNPTIYGYTSHLQIPSACTVHHTRNPPTQPQLPHHIRYLQHTTTAIPITPHILSTQPQLHRPTNFQHITTCLDVA